MATIKAQGTGYKITVSCGYDTTGRQIRKHMTWSPTPGMTARQIEKELRRQETLFEEKCRCSDTHDGNIRLADFTEVFLQDYAQQHLKAKTIAGYRDKMARINTSIGHIRLKDLRSGHIAQLYADMMQPGARRGAALAHIRIDFRRWMADHKTTMAALSRDSGISPWTYKLLRAGKPIAPGNAHKIAAQLGSPFNEIFLVVQDTTPLKPSTICDYHRVLSAVLARAVKWGYIDRNPAERVDLPSNAGHHAAYLDEPDARRLLELLQSEPIRWRTLITFDLLSGLRRGELLGLRWADVDFDNCTIAVKQTLNYTTGVGVYFDTPKTTKSARPMKLSRTAMLLLQETQRWQDQQRSRMGDAWRNAHDLVFTTDFGGPIFPDSVSSWFSAFIRRSGLPKVTVHSLRHTYASLMISDGVPLVVVSHQLGHALTSTTANIYAHVISSAEAKAADIFDRFGDVAIPNCSKAVNTK